MPNCFSSAAWRGGWALAVAATALCAVPAHAQQSTQTVSIVGRVVDSLHQPVPDATVRIESMSISTRSDPLGRFRLNEVPEGLHLLQVRKIGYGPVDIVVRAPRDTSLAAVVLTPGAVNLQTVVTTSVNQYGKPGRLAYTSRYDDFYERRANNTGSGRFYTEEDIDRMGVSTLIDVLRRIPPLMVHETADGLRLDFPRCHMNGIYIAIDGNRIWPRGQVGAASLLTIKTDPSMLDPTSTESGPDPLLPLRGFPASSIEAIESYPGSSSLPAEAVGNACAALLFWTK